MEIQYQLKDLLYQDKNIAYTSIEIILLEFIDDVEEVCEENEKKLSKKIALLIFSYVQQEIIEILTKACQWLLENSLEYQNTSSSSKNAYFKTLQLYFH